MGNILKSIAKGLGSVASMGAGLIPGVGKYASAAIDGLVGSFSSQSDVNASLRAQNELLQKQQQFAHDEAQLNRDFQQSMFDQSNAYNSPKAQVDRLVEAGLNPQLAYGGSMAEASPMSGSMASSSGAPSVDGLSNRSLMAAQIANINAQTNLIKSQTNKTDAETQTQLTYNEWQDALLGQEIQKGSVSIRAGLEGINLTQAQRLKCYKVIDKTLSEINNLDAATDELRSRGMLEDSQRFLNEIDRQFRRKEINARIEKICADTGLSKSQAYAAVKNAISNAAQVAFNTSPDNPLNRVLNIQADGMQLDFNILSEEYFGEPLQFWFKWNDAIKEYAVCLTDIIGSIMGKKLSPPGSGFNINIGSK